MNPRSAKRNGFLPNQKLESNLKLEIESWKLAVVLAPVSIFQFPLFLISNFQFLIPASVPNCTASRNWKLVSSHSPFGVQGFGVVAIS